MICPLAHPDKTGATPLDEETFCQDPSIDFAVTIMGLNLCKPIRFTSFWKVLISQNFSWFQSEFWVTLRWNR